MGDQVGEELKLGPGTRLRVIAHDVDELLLQATYAPAGSAPPAHLHPAQDERFEVIAGAMRTRIDSQEAGLSEGEVLEIPHGTPHQMWNGGDREAVVEWRTRPAGRTLEWFGQLSAMLAGESAADPAALLAEYADVFRLVEE
ncbi:MAG TPA: cupin domain-containing protein [Solirubrobacteraceae bacterium]|jgi:mannose-6-phosphate isomerase-like protein (cupin superfamily)|nr:cupin domain-containing protein [Solirubrobacteraceae bacterium]